MYVILESNSHYKKQTIHNNSTLIHEQIELTTHVLLFISLFLCSVVDTQVLLLLKYQITFLNLSKYFTLRRHKYDNCDGSLHY